ncbi:hypothetical protein Q6350_03650 [Isoptericola sp. b515]|uniref:hypothetical protein n=1 Tax=Isoptericola sp. b515 TaxID=3064652 RepID=UPI002714426B|nr:hypothetical protein [Isoptericola sp. b515]MDO8147518.1 hypothetical protein [Isoptericola sp. b515]
MQNGERDVPDGLVEAAGTLDLRPRECRWTSVTYCLLDAVWSIGIHYDRHVVPAVRRVAATAGDERPVVPTDEALPPDPLPLTAFRDAYPDVKALEEKTSAHRTSSRSGILKADAALRYADVLLADEIDTLADARAALDDADRVERLTRELRRIPGDGVRTGYFWMLVGDDDTVKPDRMILGYLARHGVDTDLRGAKATLKALAEQLSTEDRPVTPWMVDHAMWNAERSLHR